MNTEVFFDLHNGLGDRLLDMLGMMVACHFTNKQLCIPWRYDYPGFQWGEGVYDKRLIDIEGVKIVDSSEGRVIVNHVLQGIQLCPYNVFRILQSKNIDVTFDNVANMFVSMAKNIKPAGILISELDPRLANAHGIHLRKSDKISSINGANIAFDNDHNEFDAITTLLKADIESLIKTEDSPSFFVCSEDRAWREEFKAYIRTICEIHGKDVTIIDNKTHTDYKGFADLYDFFSLSCCKSIYQGVKHSGFSVVAAMIGRGNLVNYIERINDARYFSINLWKPCVHVNGKRNLDEGVQKDIMNHWGSQWNPVYLPN